MKSAFFKVNDALLVLERSTEAGTSLVFGYLGGGPEPFAVSNVGATFVLAFRALPIVLVVSALSALLFYWRVLPAVASGAMDAITRGTLEGAQPLVNIVAMLVVFVALVALGLKSIVAGTLATCLTAAAAALVL
ncbi:MAG TPA: hypothetical protein VFI86_02505 [Burkholderiales bacterium]|nr:hypothetical protein [Burkholderiales bacterium]